MLNENQISVDYDFNNDLLMNLNEGVFFLKVSKYLGGIFKDKDMAIFLSYNDESTRLLVQNNEIVEDSPLLKRGEGPSGYVTKTKKIYFSNNVKRDPLYSNIEVGENVISELVVPINCDGVILGTIHIRSKNENDTFSENDALKIRELINSIIMPLRNMKMYLLAKHLNFELMDKLKEKNNELKVEQSFFVKDVEILGHDSTIINLINTAKKIARDDIPVLIEGEAGVGKRLMAKKIHTLSQRSKSAMLIFECAASNETYIEKELFGYGQRKGMIELTNAGTLVLNDIDELSLPLQSKILNFLTTGVITRMDAEERIPVNVRIVAVTKKDLKELITAGKFREDLFYRLSTVSMAVPSMRERNSDIKILAEHFLNENKSELKFLTSNAIAKLLNYSWPGNVLELKNIMERTYALTEGKYVEDIDLPEGQVEEIAQPIQEEAFKETTLFDLEKRHICKTLEHLKGNKTRAAKSLGITVKTLYNKLHSYGLIKPKSF
jgi:Nif-specific regulatory protein